VPFEDCLDTYFGAELVDMGRGVTASKTTKLLGFPRYLMVKLGRYTIDSSWRQVKIDARVPMPESLDINHLKATGIQAGEEIIEENATVVSSAGAVTPDAMLVSQLVSMGFSENACRRAAIAVNNAGADQAMAWVFEHMEDPDFNDPPESVVTNNVSAASSASSMTANPEVIMMLTSMGFTDKQAAKALRNTDNNLERAADWLFNHPDDDGSDDPSPAAVTSDSPGSFPEDTADGRYELHAIISHIGRNTDCGHYVSHIKKDGRWIFFNDDKVAESTNPPIDCGFMYLYKRTDIESPTF